MERDTLHAGRTAAIDQPLEPVPWSAVVLSMVVVVCAAAASLVTLFTQASFPDPSLAASGNRALAEARGWSVATLLVALPIVVLSLRAARHGSLRGRLVWLGALAYFVYTYLELAVSPPFTALYLVYVAAFACAIPALVIGVASIDIPSLPATFGERVPRRTSAVFVLLVAALLASAWLSSIASRTLAGAFGWPFGEDAIGHVVHALDLGLQVPLGVAAGVLLLRRKAAGLLVAAIMLVNFVCMGAALMAMVLCSNADAGTSAWSAAPFAIVWMIGSALAVVFFRSGIARPI